MLETIREFAVGRLEESPEVEDIRRRHAEHMAAIAPMLGVRARESNRTAIDELAIEHDNARAALGWGLAAGRLGVCERLIAGLWSFWLIRGLVAEGWRWARAVVEGTAAPSEGLLGNASELARFNGDLDAAAELKGREIELLEISGDSYWLAAALADLAEIAAEQGQLVHAQQLADRAYAIRCELGDPWGLAHARSARVRIALHREYNHLAAELARESIPVYHAAESWGDLAWERVLAATACRRLGQRDQARELLVEAVSDAGRIDDRSSLAGVLEQTAALCATSGEHEEGLRLFGAARAWRRSSGYAFDADPSACQISSKELAPDSCDALVNEGARWTLDGAVQRALVMLNQ